MSHGMDGGDVRSDAGQVGQEFKGQVRSTPHGRVQCIVEWWYDSSASVTTKLTL